MSEICSTTGFSKKSKERWPYLWQKLTNGQNNAFPNPADIKSIDEGIRKALKIKDSSSGEKNRQNLIKHLRKIICSKIKGSTLEAFGSSQSGLSLIGGDLDLCLKVSDINPKQILRRLKGLLDARGMEQITLISKARIPIIKFHDPKSGFDVDISINNSLALHNTELLSSYARLDPAVKDAILAVKYWAIQRNIANAYQGTISSYSWSLLSLQHLQVMESIKLPNLQSSENREFVTIDNHEYDITINKEVEVNEINVDIGQIFAEFIFYYGIEFDWSKQVVSIRNGMPLERSEKGWVYRKPSASTTHHSDDKKLRMGLYHLPIEDPLDMDIDLGRVLKPAGELTILNEFLRAASMLSEGKSFDEICETVEPQRFESKSPDDLFEDLRNLKPHEVKILHENILDDLSIVTKRIETLESERSNAIRMAKAMRGIIEETGDIRKKHKETIQSLRSRGKEIELTKNKRDQINKNIVLPLHRIEEELIKIYSRLTDSLDLMRVQSLEREKRDFSFFFELQKMYHKAKSSSELHQKYNQLRKEQRKDIESLRKFESEHDEVAQNILDQEPLLKQEDLENRHDRSWDKRANKITIILRKRKKELYRFRREKGRIEAWMRITQKNNAKRKGTNRNKTHRPTSQIRETVASGGSISLGDLDALLKSGGISNLNQKTESTQKRPKRKKGKMKNLNNLSPHRGERNKYSRKE